jgi:hypothetical protein
VKTCSLCFCAYCWSSRSLTANTNLYSQTSHYKGAEIIFPWTSLNIHHMKQNVVNKILSRKFRDPNYQSVLWVLMARF